MEPTLLILIIFFASFTQSIAGFGLGLVAMPLLVEPLGVTPAAALVGIIAVIVRVVLIIVYRESINFGVVLRLILASTVGLPIGVLVLQHMDDAIVLPLLGIVISGYALYALLAPRLPPVSHPGWTLSAGFFSGLLSGAYNTGGPPVVMYGTSRRWEPDEFKSNLQGFGLFNSTVAIALRAVDGNYAAAVWSQLLLVLPAVAVGLLIGLVVSRFINRVLFRRMVLILLLFVGLRLIF